MKTCTVCKTIFEKSNFSFRISKTGTKYYSSECKQCACIRTRNWAKINKDKVNKNNTVWRNNNKQYSKEAVQNWKIKNKAAVQSYVGKRRATKLQATPVWDLEFTNFVYKEAHELRKLRNKLFGFEWHVDHTIPLKGHNVSGLHVWNNFAVIPKVDNLRKGNYHSIHD